MRENRLLLRGIIREDKIDDFLKIGFNISNNNAKPVKVKSYTKKITRSGGLRKMIKNKDIILSKTIKNILSNNTGKILDYLFQNYDLSYTELLVFFNKFKNVDNHKTYTKLFFDLMLYKKTDFTPEEYAKLINKFASYKAYHLVDLIHMLGYRTTKLIDLVDNYPSSKYYDLKKFDYNIDSIVYESRILNNKIKTVDELNKIILFDPEIIRKHIDVCLSEFNYDMIKCLTDNNLFTIDKKTIKTICKEENIQAILFALETKPDINLSRTNMFNMFGVNVENKNKLGEVQGGRRKSRKQSKWRLRRNKENELKRKSLDDKYDENMEKVVQKIINSGKNIYFPVKAWDKLVKNKCVKTIEALVNTGLVPKMDKYFVEKQLYNLVYQDDITTLKEMIKNKVFDPIKITKMKKLVDLTIVYGLEKMKKYFINELHMKCSSILINQYIGTEHGWRNNLTRIGFTKLTNKKIECDKFIEIITEIEYPIKQSDLTEAINNNKYELVEYFVKNKNMKATNDDIDRVIVKNNQKMLKLIATYDDKNNIILDTKNMVDRLLRKTYKQSEPAFKRYRRFRRYSQEMSFLKCSKLREIVKKYKCTASNNAMKTAIKEGDLKTVKYLNKKFKLTCEKIPIMPNVENNNRYWYRRRGNMIELANYCVKNKDKLKITEENLNMNRLIKYSLSQYSMDKKLFNKMVNDCDYQFDETDLINIQDNRHDGAYKMYLNQIFNKEYESIEQKDEQIRKLVSYSNRNVSWMELLSEKIDLNNYISLKDVNILLSHGGRHYKAKICELLDKISDDKVTPYSVEVFTMNNWRPDREILEKLLRKTENKVTEQGKNHIIHKLNRLSKSRFSKPVHLKKMKKMIESCTETIYEPDLNERVDIEYEFEDRRVGYNNINNNGNNGEPIDGEIGIINQIERELDREMMELESEDGLSESGSDRSDDLIDDKSLVTDSDTSSEISEIIVKKGRNIKMIKK